MSRQDDPDDLVLRARELLDGLDTGDGVLVLSDIFGATPCNLCRGCCEDGQVEGVAGVNLPMLVRALTYRKARCRRAVQRASPAAARACCT